MVDLLFFVLDTIDKIDWSPCCTGVLQMFSNGWRNEIVKNLIMLMAYRRVFLQHQQR